MREHRDQHKADFMTLIAPAFAGTRIHKRAAEEKVLLVHAEQLGGLLQLHAQVPLGLDTYRCYF